MKTRHTHGEIAFSQADYLKNVTTRSTIQRADSCRAHLASTLVLAAWLTICRAQGDAMFTTIYSFTGGENRWAVQGKDGDFYLTAHDFGPPSYDGAVLRMTTNGALTTLVVFRGVSNGAYPVGPLVQGSDGNFYGATSGGGNAVSGTNSGGTVFQMTPDGILTTLYSFAGGSDGNGPYGALVQGADGNFYGTATYRVFKMTPDGTLTTLHSFYPPSSDGGSPSGGLAQGTDGNFYGTTVAGGANGAGTFFKITPDGTLTTLASLSFPGWTGAGIGVSTLLLGSDGNFYGSTQAGGTYTNENTHGFGTLFRVTTNGTLTILASFSRTNGAVPTHPALVQGSDGNFYGTTSSGGVYSNSSYPQGFGTVFQVTADGVITALISFNGTNGIRPSTGLILASDGNFYGATFTGGPSGGGTFFRLSVPGAASPKIIASAKSGSTFATTWLALAGRSYQLQFATNLNQSVWTESGGPIIATNFTVTASDPVGSDRQRFYRVALLP